MQRRLLTHLDNSIYYPLPQTATEERGAITLQVGLAQTDPKMPNLDHKIIAKQCYDMFSKLLDGYVHRSLCNPS